jgi:hypothetical protein
MSPLAEAIYQVLFKRVKLKIPVITYTALVQALPPLDPPDDGVTPADKRLFNALGEVGIACREQGLATISALVIRGADKAPGAGYYRMFHPKIGADPVRRQEAWSQDLEQVKNCNFPQTLGKSSSVGQPVLTSDQHKLRRLGTLRIAEESPKSRAVFTGQVICPSCSKSLAVEIQRNSNALTEKQPAFVVVGAEGAPPDELGHLFVGSILTSPVLYYGAFKHCKKDHWVSIFFNRGLRDRSDDHFTILQSTSKQSPHEIPE